MRIKGIIILMILAMSACKEDISGTINLRVNYYTEDCESLFSQQCLLVQEGDLIGTEEWDYLYEGIEGFDYETGYIYELKVNKINIPNPPADASSVRYELLEILSRIKQ